jgi:hypothetical protein
LTKAKKELCKRGNILDDLDDDKSDDDFSIAEMVESEIKVKDDKGVYGVLSPRIAQGKFYTESTKIFPSIPASQSYITKLKTYYLEEVSKAMSG